MEIGISTACLYPFETEKSLLFLLEQGFRTFEIFFNSDSEISTKFIHMLGARLKEYHASVYSCHLYTSGFEPLFFFSDYSRRFDDSVELYRRYCAALMQTGARVIVFHGDRRDSSITIEAYCDRFYKLSQAVAAEGAILAQENVSRCRSALAADIRRMHEILGGDAKFILDVKQALRAGESPADMLAAMAGSIVNVHLSDHSAQRDCMLPGAGEMDYKRLISSLRQACYDGPLIIEVYRSDFKALEELDAARGFLQPMISGYIA
jgi:sugar phosphate isomerase/epimerase